MESTDIQKIKVVKGDDEKDVGVRMKASGTNTSRKETLFLIAKFLILLPPGFGWEINGRLGLLLLCNLELRPQGSMHRYLGGVACGLCQGFFEFVMSMVIV